MHSIAWWPTLIVVSIATVTDLRSRRIPNWLVYPFVLAGVVVSGWLYGWHGIGQSLSGLGLGTLVYGVLFYLGGMGMGDVKLCAAIGAWIGPSQLMIALVATGIAGGMMAVCWAVSGGYLADALKNMGDLVVGVRERGLRPHPELVLGSARARTMPYAPAIAIGTLFSFFSR